MTVTYQQIESLILQLSATKKAQLLNFLSKNLGNPFPGIVHIEGVVGGSACIIRTRIPVWTLVSYKKQGLTDSKLLEAYPTLRAQDLKNAWFFYKANKKEIDREIQENNAA